MASDTPYRVRWRYRGNERPSFAIEPRPSQESIWNYPRPPAIVPDPRRAEVRYGDLLTAGSANTVRVDFPGCG